MLAVPSSVQVAGDSRLVSQSVLCSVPWTVDDCTFWTDFRTLPLANFDVIINMDWLKAHSLIQVDWHQKWLAVPHEGEIRILQVCPQLVLCRSSFKLTCCLTTHQNQNLQQ